MLKTVGNPSTRYGDQTIIDGNLVIGTAGKGIDFSASPSAAGMTSELLDDYEEGTWTPDYDTTNGDLTTTIDFSYARYVKIGGLVHVGGYFRTDAVSGGTGNVVIKGLPFTAGPNNYWLSSMSLSRRTGFVNVPVSGRVISATNTILLLRNNADSMVVGDLGTGVNANDIMFSLVYNTDA